MMWNTSERSRRLSAPHHAVGYRPCSGLEYEGTF